MLNRRTITTLIVALGFCSQLAFAEPPRNVILMIGDGMGFEHVKAAGMYRDGLPGNLSMESLPYQGQVTTYSANASVTDSAAAGTAIATGHKVNNGVISLQIPGNGSELQTLLEYYQLRNAAVGLVTTTYVTHATPAAFGAHETDRNNYASIGNDYATQTRPDVLFGGGKYVTPTNAAAAGFDVVTSRSTMQAYIATGTNPLAGLFGTDYMIYEYDYFTNASSFYNTMPHLSEMAAKAIDILEDDPDGFFLMIEGGRIDHAAHSNLLQHNVFETIEFDATVEAVLTWAQSRSDTLVIVTADHETGGMQVISNNGQNNFPTVTWSSTGHTGVNVPAFGDGPNAELITGTLDNTEFFGIVTADTMPAMHVSTDAITTEIAFQAEPTDNTFTIRNTSVGTLSYSITDDAAWLQVTPTTDDNNGELDTITASYDVTGLSKGTHTATITVTSPNARNTVETINVELVMLPGPAIDTDEDGDVDQTDFGMYQACLAGAGVHAVPPCDALDLDDDEDVDATDIQIFQNCMNGADITYDINCLN